MTETAVETYETTTRGAASMAAYRAVRILQLLSENTGEDKAMLSDELIRRLAHPDDPARMPISAARRSIYTAISALRHAGYEIEYKRGVGYRLLTRPLTDEEIIRLHGMVMPTALRPSPFEKAWRSTWSPWRVPTFAATSMHPSLLQAQATNPPRPYARPSSASMPASSSSRPSTTEPR